MSESVEQAATVEGWRARAVREAAALLDGSNVTFFGVGQGTITNRDEVLSLLAVAWLQGTIYGSHETLGGAEVAFDSLRTAL